MALAKMRPMSPASRDPLAFGWPNPPPRDGERSLAALTGVLNALTELPSGRAKARVLRFVQDYFDERNGQ